MFEIKESILIKCICDDEIITLPNDVKEISYKAFTNCKAKKIICNDGLVKIGSYAFWGSEIEEIILPSTLKYIDEYAFANCFNLTSINFVDGLETIGDYAFKSTKLEKLNIPSSVNKIGINPFTDCSYLTEIQVDTLNPYYSSYNYSNTICEKENHKIISGCKKTVIDETIVEIGKDAFNGTGLTEITIPNGVKTIENNCFANNALKVINTNNVSVINDGAFMDNSKLETITFSSNLKIINSSIVSRCDKLDEVVLPNGVELICLDAFYNFLGKKVIIPNSIKVVEEKAFSYCSRLNAIDFLGTKEQWLKAVGDRDVFYDTKKAKAYSVNCIDGTMLVPVFNS